MLAKGNKRNAGLVYFHEFGDESPIGEQGSPMMSRDSASDIRAAGSCLCGAVRYEVTGALRDVILCHCEMCRKTHGHVAAYAATAKSALRISETRGLKWYRSSETARRGFCTECGASMFWEPSAKDYIAIAAGTLDGPTGLKTSVQIHVESAGDYYAVDERIPERSR